MSLTPKPSKRDRIRGILHRSPSPLPARPKPSPTGVFPSPLPHSESGSRSSSILADALESLSQEERETLRNQLSPDTFTVNAAVADVYRAASDLQKTCEGKRWHWTYNERVIYLQDQVGKVLQMVAMVKPVGDAAACIDPIHVGLPWAGIVALLKVALADTNQRNALLTGMELSLYVANRLKIYLDSFTLLLPSQTTKNFRKALVELYAQVRGFLAHAIHVLEKPGLQRFALAIWNDGSLAVFEEKCDKLCRRAGEEASLCEREFTGQWRDDLDQKLQSLDAIHSVQASLVGLHDKAELAKLITAKNATYDGTSKMSGKRIFWLHGMAGTGKSTLSRTVAQVLEDEGRLGATFFFKRGQVDRSHASLFFPTIARQLADKVPGLGHAIAAALEKESLLCEKYIAKQFNELLLHPLSGLQGHTLSDDIFIVIDALDECESTGANEIILNLLKRIETMTTARIRILVTSRHDIPIISEFGHMSPGLYEDIRVEVAQTTSITSDLKAFFEHEFLQIKNKYAAKNRYSSLLPEWPGNDVVDMLVERAHPLFIVAFTLCGQISEARIPQEQLSALLAQRGSLTGRLAGTYVPVLEQAVFGDTEQSQQDNFVALWKILAPLVLLYDPLSANALATLLVISTEEVGAHLPLLQSVLVVPEEVDRPIELFHLSFRDFLVNSARKDDGKFWINEPETHFKLAQQCVDLLGASLREDVCNVEDPGTLRKSIEKMRIAASLPEAVVYACRYWVPHLVASGQKIGDRDFVHGFLERHFTHWMEALSWLGRTSDVIHNLEELQTTVDGRELSSIWLGRWDSTTLVSGDRRADA
ncbi:hypothetical protein LTR08_003714 [Meristemomyces frigidus]|nr:hypothetical protein LTR08_003714 [Meristemomyces frigidus]